MCLFNITYISGSTPQAKLKEMEKGAGEDTRLGFWEEAVNRKGPTHTEPRALSSSISQASGEAPSTHTRTCVTSDWSMHPTNVTFAAPRGESEALEVGGK